MTGPTHATTSPNGGRTYRHPVSGIEVPSVTSVLRQVGSAEGLIQWSANCAAEWAIQNRELLARPDAYDTCRTAHKRHRDSAGRRGTNVHAVAEKIARGEPVTTYDRTELGGYVDALEDWFATNTPRVVHTEATCWNVHAGYAGTADLHYKQPGEKNVTVLDWKTSKAFAADMPAQLAAYANATELTEAGSRQCVDAPTVKRAVVVKLAADGTWEQREADLKAGWELFRAALTVHRLHSITATYAAKATKGGANPDRVGLLATDLRARVTAIVQYGHGAPQALAARWPADVPTFKQGGPSTYAQCAALDTAVGTVETEYEIPF